MEISYNLPVIASASEEIARAAAMTEQNLHASIQLLTANADHFDGKGQMSFNDALTTVHHLYDQARETIKMAGIAVAQAGDTMGVADASAAAQYL